MEELLLDIPAAPKQTKTSKKEEAKTARALLSQRRASEITQAGRDLFKEHAKEALEQCFHKGEHEAFETGKGCIKKALHAVYHQRFLDAYEEIAIPCAWGMIHGKDRLGFHKTTLTYTGLTLGKVCAFLAKVSPRVPTIEVMQWADEIEPIQCVPGEHFDEDPTYNCLHQVQHEVMAHYAIKKSSCHLPYVLSIDDLNQIEFRRTGAVDVITKNGWHTLWIKLKLKLRAHMEYRLGCRIEDDVFFARPDRKARVWSKTVEKLGSLEREIDPERMSDKNMEVLGFKIKRQFKDT